MAQKTLKATFMRPLSRLAALAIPSLLLPSLAEAKNVFPYNHPDLDWYSIETEHFVVHYPQNRHEDSEHPLSAEWTAKKSAKIAEEMYPRMSAEFNYYIKEKIHIVILDQGDELEGFTVPPWDWIEISANPGVDFYRQRGRMDWLPDVLVHEYAHVVSLKAQASLSEGSFGTLIGGLYTDGISNTASGGEILIGDTEPQFWVEGGAEFWSDNAGYNWWTPSRDMHIRTSVLEGRLLNFTEWQTQIQSLDWGDGERWYQQGYSFALYLRQRFGADTYAKFGLRQGKAWQFDWLNGVEEVTGVPAEQLYNDWVDYISKKYNAQWDQVKAEGEVVGRELLPARKPWEYTDPAGRDKWMDLRFKRKGITGEELARMDREAERHKTGTWSLNPKYSADGKWYGVNSRGVLILSQTPEESWPAFSGVNASDPGNMYQAAYNTYSIPGDFMANWDFIPGQDAVIVVKHEDDTKGSWVNRHMGISFEGDGYNWKELWYVPIPVEEGKKDKNITYTGIKHKPRQGLKDARPIPNTKRGIEPTVSPDGQKIAYFEYADGTLNLVTINIDGSDKKHLTNFKDGTWLQRVDWSPDGKQLVLALFRNFQQDLYILDADGSNIRPIMYDRWEDQDPLWAEDGRIYFSSDRNAIFNIYRYDPKTNKIDQITNVIGGAECPFVTPQGNLLFNYYTAFGWKNYGLSKADFMGRDVSDAWNLEPDMEAFKASWEFREDLSMYTPVKYNHAIMAPAGIPIVRITNDSRDDLSVQFGAQAFVSDYTEDHSAFIYGLAGSDLLLAGGYTYAGWYPTIDIFGYHGEFKINAGYLLDDDGNANTVTDQSIYEIRNQQYVNLLALTVSYPWNDRFNTSAFAQGLDVGFRSGSDERYYRYLINGEAGLRANFTNIGWQGYSANPRGGRNIDLAYSHGFTDVVYEPYGGHTVDDGELLDSYQYNKVEARWTEQLGMPVWEWLPEFIKIAGQRKHTIQLDVYGGFLDRNVDTNDEFRGGGQHPYYWGSDSLRPNTLFAGYPQSSLSGETMGIISLAYRFPIRRQINRKVGPFYFYDLTAQVMGTAGNFWSYRAPENEADYYRNQYGDRVAYRPENIRREIPFIDYAYKNGNAMLYDAGAEVRLGITAFNNGFWNSFFRVAYGFNEVRGYGDVNGDDIQDTTDNAIGDELSNEVEPAGFRFYLGLGTGW
jgi:hypothetical protein